MDISRYGYSYANYIGNSLCAPVDYAITNITETWHEGGITLLIGLIWHSVIGVIIAVPCGLPWLAGRVVHLCAASKINYENLHKQPASLNLNPVLNNASKIDVKDLRKYLIFTRNTASLKQQIDTIINQCESTQSYSDLGQKQMTIFVKAIVKKMAEGNLSNDRKGTIINELASSTNYCQAKRIDTSGKIYFELYGNADSVESKLLRAIQDYKESIIMQYCEGNVHYMNKIRQVLGDELGLNVELGNLEDVDALYQYSPDCSFIRTTFHDHFKDVNRMVEAVQTNINMCEYDVTYKEFLEKIVRDKNVPNPEAFVAQNFYTLIQNVKGEEIASIKFEGVNLMLRTIDLIR